MSICRRQAECQLIVKKLWGKIDEDAWPVMVHPQVSAEKRLEPKAPNESELVPA